MKALDEGGFNGRVVVVEPADACVGSIITNANELAGNIALIDRTIGVAGCEFYQKVYLAQLAGAVAVIIGNTLTTPFTGIMLGYQWWGAPVNPNVSLITIPSVLVPLDAANAIKCRSNATATVTVTVNTDTAASRANRATSYTCPTLTPSPTSTPLSICVPEK
jgi:hypothetical protein